MLEKIKAQKDSFFFICLVLSIVTLPFSIRLNSISIVVLVVAWLFKNSFQDKIKLLKNPLFFLFIALYALYLFGMLWTQNLPHGLYELEKKLALFVFPLMFCSIPPLTDKEKNKVLFYFVTSCVILSLVCISYATYRAYIANSFFEINPQSNYVTHYFFYFGLSEAFIHPVYFSAYIVFAVFILFNYYNSSKEILEKKRRLLILILIIYLIVFLCLLSSRIMILYFSMCSVLYLFYILINTQSLNSKIVLGVFMPLSIVLAVIYIPAIRSRFNEVIDSSYSFENNPEKNKNLSGKLDGIEMKLAQWYYTIEAGKNNKLIGVGTGDDEDELQKKYYENNFMEGYIPKYNSHNQYFQTWLGLGYFGLFTLLIAFFVPIYLAIRQKQLLYLSFLFLVMFFCLTESILCRQHGVVFYSFFNSFFAFNLVKKQ